MCGGLEWEWRAVFPPRISLLLLQIHGCFVRASSRSCPATPPQGQALTPLRLPIEKSARRSKAQNQRKVRCRWNTANCVQKIWKAHGVRKTGAKDVKLFLRKSHSEFTSLMLPSFFKRQMCCRTIFFLSCKEISILTVTHCCHEYLFLGSAEIRRPFCGANHLKTFA